MCLVTRDILQAQCFGTAKTVRMPSFVFVVLLVCVFLATCEHTVRAFAYRHVISRKRILVFVLTCSLFHDMVGVRLSLQSKYVPLHNISCRDGGMPMQTRT